MINEGPSGPFSVKHSPGYPDVNVITKLHQSQSMLLRAVTAATLVALAASGGYALSAHKTVTLNVDGAPVTVTTMQSRVIDVVRENGFEVSDRDDLYPPADRPVADAETIVLRRSRPLEISLDGQQSTQVWTTASTVDEALEQLGDDRHRSRGGVAGDEGAARGDGPAGGQPQDGADRRRRIGADRAFGRIGRRCAAERRRVCPSSSGTRWCRRHRRRS